MTDSIREGAPAPDFTLMDADGEMVSLAAHRGRNVVLYFYPKDDTSGCTKEALGFEAHLAEFEAAGCSILGVSPDPVASHRRFADKHGLTCRLLADPDKEAIQAYGVWVEKSMYGRRYMGVERTTLLIDAEGRIARVWSKVKVPGHVEEVLEAARALKTTAQSPA